jgi:hypothetical protein
VSGFSDRTVAIPAPREIGTGGTGRSYGLSVQSRVHRQLCYSRILVRVRSFEIRPPASKAGALPHELYPDGARRRIRTPIFNSSYGSPVRSRRRLCAHLKGHPRLRGRWSRLRVSNPSLPLRVSRRENGQTDDRSVAHRQGETEERSSNFWTFTFQTAWPKKATRTQKLTAAAYAARLNSVLSSWCSGPSAPLLPVGGGVALRRLFRSRKP